MTFLCRLDDIPDDGSNGFADRAGRRLLAVRLGGEVFVYINSCPHTGAPMDFTPGQFMNLEKNHILCANHGALFNIEDGLCVHGPCPGECLEAVKTEIRGGGVYLLD